MTIDDYIKWANKEIDKNESYIQAADGLPGLYYDAEEVKGYEKNIEHYKQLVEYLEDCKKGYIHIDDVYRLIAGHSNYHGDDILTALTCIAEGKNVTKPITPLDKKDCSNKNYKKLRDLFEVGKVYHGDDILAAITCVEENRPVRPFDGIELYDKKKRVSMTVEEAIEIIKREITINEDTKKIFPEVVEAYNMAIHSLEAWEIIKDNLSQQVHHNLDVKEKFEIGSTSRIECNTTASVLAGVIYLIDKYLAEVSE